MSLVKIPFMLASIAGIHVTLTTPAPPPLGHESRAKTEGPIRVTHAVPVTKYFLWVITIIEIITIIAQNTAWSPISKYALSVLMVNGNAQTLQLTPLSAVGALICACGGLIRRQCYRIMGRQFTFELSICEDHKLVTAGPYGVVRHPGYSGILVAFIGMACLHAPCGSWLRESGILGTEVGRILVGAVTTMTYAALGSLKWRMHKEDDALREVFGPAWEEWARKVPYAMIPGIY